MLIWVSRFLAYFFQRRNSLESKHGPLSLLFCLIIELLQLYLPLNYFCLCSLIQWITQTPVEASAFVDLGFPLLSFRGVPPSHFYDFIQFSFFNIPHILLPLFLPFSFLSLLLIPALILSNFSFLLKRSHIWWLSFRPVIFLLALILILILYVQPCITWTRFLQRPFPRFPCWLAFI